MSEPVIDITGLTRRFGDKTALDSVNLSLPRGAVYGLVGANGAGKTTLIRHIMGLLRAESGSVRVFGLDPVADPVAVLSRIGYLSEENDIPGWMRVDELIRYSRAFYPDWDDPQWLRWTALDHLGDLPCHPIEIFDNNSDYAHLNYLHGGRVRFYENEVDGHFYWQRQTMVFETGGIDTTRAPC